MTRIDLDKNIKACSFKDAAKKFATYLIKNNYDWAADEILECVENGYFCMSNASSHPLVEETVVFPASSDWTYFWAIENADGENQYYAWLIERI